MGFTKVNDPAGATHVLEAVVGWRTADTSRLSCQIIWDTHLDGLEVTLAGGQDP
jgi:hypothetical protein